jgi:hypothetical protein
LQQQRSHVHPRTASVAHLTFRRVGADDPGRRGKTTNHPAQITTPPHTPNISLRNYSAHGRCHPAERRSKSARRHLAINTLEWQVSAWTSRLPSHHILRSQGQPKCPPGPVGDTSSHRNVDPHILRPCRTPTTERPRALTNHTTPAQAPRTVCSRRGDATFFNNTLGARRFASLSHHNRTAAISCVRCRHQGTDRHPNRLRRCAMPLLPPGFFFLR